MMEYRIETFPETLLVGLCLRMSIAQNRTGKLWQSFMPRREEIQHTTGDDLFSVQFYPTDYFQAFSPAMEFEKWAAVSVDTFDELPEGMEQLTIQEGLYARFFYKGSSANAPQVFGWIFGTWLPQSDYELDYRPHFEILSDRYRHNDPASEEEIWIPVRKKVVER